MRRNKVMLVHLALFWVNGVSIGCGSVVGACTSITRRPIPARAARTPARPHARTVPAAHTVFGRAWLLQAHRNDHVGDQSHAG